MSVTSVYLIIALATAIFAHYELVNPVIEYIKKNHPDANVNESLNLAILAMFLFSMILAPFILPITLVPSFAQRYRESLVDSLLEI